jgi:carbonic anhydrase
MARLVYSEYLKSGQSPEMIVVGCSDSRVPVETVYTGLKFEPGKIFAVENAGNYGLTNSALAAIYYAVKHLGTRKLVICGHSNCGAMKALIHMEEEKDTVIRNYLASIKNDVFGGTLPTTNVDELARENVNRQVEYFVNQDSVIAPLVQKREMVVEGHYFDFSGESPYVAVINRNGERLENPDRIIELN